MNANEREIHLRLFAFIRVHWRTASFLLRRIPIPIPTLSLADRCMRPDGR